MLHTYAVARTRRLKRLPNLADPFCNPQQPQLPCAWPSPEAFFFCSPEGGQSLALRACTACICWALGSLSAGATQPRRLLGANGAQRGTPRRNSITRNARMCACVCKRLFCHGASLGRRFLGFGIWARWVGADKSDNQLYTLAADLSFSQQ